MVIPNLRNRLPPLGSLASFEAASRHESFTRAATELNLTQAAVSRQILVLEKYLGVRLFERLRHNVRLTAEGERFAAKVNPALITISEVAASLKSGFVDELTIRSEFCLATHWLMPRLSRFQLMHPGLSLKVMTSNRPIETEREQFHIALGYGAVHGSNLQCEPLATDAMVPVCNPETRRSLPEKCTAQDLADFDLIHFEQRGADWMDWREFLAVFDVKLAAPPRLVLSMYNSVIDAALHGYGVALGWRYTIDELLRDGRLVEIEGIAVDYPDPLSAQVPTDVKDSASVKDFISWVRSEIGSREKDRKGRLSKMAPRPRTAP